jgi:hypothetical protein
VIAVLAHTDVVYLRRAAEAEGAGAYFVQPTHVADLDDRRGALVGAQAQA